MKQILSIVTLMLFGLVLTTRTAHADAKADAKAFISKQLEVLKKGDLAEIKAGFTKRLQDKITAEKVEKAKKEAAKFTVDDLVDSAEAKGDSIKIKMKNGRTLTTLVKTGGKWEADTIWFN
jgi:hypothetical protein